MGGSSLEGLLGQGPSPCSEKGSPAHTTFDDGSKADKPPAAKRPRAVQHQVGAENVSGRSWEQDQQQQELDTHGCNARDPGTDGEDSVLSDDMLDHQHQQQASHEPPLLTTTIMNGILM